MKSAVPSSTRVRNPLARYRLVLVFAAVIVAIATCVRLVLVFMQGALMANGILAVAKAMLSGLVFDGIAALWLSLPPMIYLLSAPERIFRSRFQRWLFWPAAGLALFGILFHAVAELFFFAEFNGRFNFVAVDYLVYPHEVLVNIWESYPTGLILAVLAVASAALLFALRRPLGAAWSESSPFLVRVAATLAFALVLAGASAWVPASLAKVSNDRALNEIAGNGYYSFWGAVRGSRVSYEGLYAERGTTAVFGRLHELLDGGTAARTFSTRESTLRPVTTDRQPRQLNVVVVLEESLGSEFIGALQPGPWNLTPEYDALTAQGTLLTNAYSTGNRTIRAIEATTSSLPPLPGISIVRRPQSEDLFTLPEVLRERGYDTSFIYGGRALFDGMGGYLQRNGVDRVVDQNDYPDDAFRTAWGVSDDAIFDRALAEMDAQHALGRPFYSLVLTVTNHRPFTFPEGEIVPDPELSGRQNAVRYADWALGRFMREARTHDFFDRTIFVLMGDHGARVYGAADIPLGSYQVPILFIAPGLVPAGARLDTLASTMDIPPTILGLLGKDYSSKFFGNDLFEMNPEAGRALMTHNNDVALMRDGRLAVLGLHQSTRLFERGQDGNSQKLVRRPDRAGLELIEDAIAFYQGANELYENGGYLALETDSKAGEAPDLARAESTAIAEPDSVGVPGA